MIVLCFFLFVGILNTACILWSVRTGRMTVEEAREVLTDY